MPKYIASDAPLAAENARFRKNRSGSMGSFARASQATNADQQDGADRERRDDLRARPAVRVPVDETPDEPEHAAAGEHEPRQVERLVRAVALLEHERQRQDDQADRHVQPEDPLPGDPIDDGAADERAGCDGQAGDARPRPERKSALLGRERTRQDGEAQRRHDRTADSLHGSRSDQRVHRGGERGRRRSGREDGEAQDEQPAAAEAVAEGGAGQQEHRKCQRVGVHRPFELLDRRVEVGPDHRKSGRDDEVVEDDHEQCDGGDRKRPEHVRPCLHGGLRS